MHSVAMRRERLAEALEKSRRHTLQKEKTATRTNGSRHRPPRALRRFCRIASSGHQIPKPNRVCFRASAQVE